LAPRIAAARGPGIISITRSAVDTHFWSVQVFTSISPFLSLTPQRCRFNPVRHCLSFHPVTTAFPLWQRHPHLPSSKKKFPHYPSLLVLPVRTFLLPNFSALHSTLLCSSAPKPPLSLPGLLAYTTKSSRLSALQGIVLHNKPHSVQHRRCIDLLKSQIFPLNSSTQYQPSCLTQQTSLSRTAQLWTTSSRCLSLKT
jgi:hypothetical protein